MKRVSQPEPIVLRIADLLFAMYALCFFLNRKIPVDPLSLWMYGSFLIIYICMRNFSRLHLPMLGMGVVGGVIESSIAMMQWAYILDNEREFFNVTGTFGNPAELGGMLSVCFIVSIGLSIGYYKRKSLLMYIAGGASLIILCGLILSDSRAGWLAVVTGCLSIVLSQSAKFTRMVKEHSFRHCLWKGFALACIVVFLYAIYLYKKDSADGRLLVWRVTTDMICENPLLGQGVGGWQSGYMLAPAAYFERHPDVSSRMLADDVLCPYNEFLCLITEQGVFGLLLIVLLLYALLSYRTVDGLGSLYKSGILTLGVFSLFSYPSRMFLLMLFGFALCGAMKTKELGRVYIGRAVKKGILLSFFLVVGIISLWSFKEYECCLSAMRNLYGGQENWSYQDAGKFLESHYSLFRFNPAFMSAYAEYAAQYLPEDKAEEVLQATIKIAPSCELFCETGEFFERKGESAEAAQYYRKAADMIPARMTPKYKLFRLYANAQDTVAACAAAKTLLYSTEKKPGTKTIRMRAIAKDYLDNYACPVKEVQKE